MRISHSWRNKSRYKKNIVEQLEYDIIVQINRANYYNYSIEEYKKKKGREKRNQKSMRN